MYSGYFAYTLLQATINNLYDSIEFKPAWFNNLFSPERALPIEYHALALFGPMKRLRSLSKRELIQRLYKYECMEQETDNSDFNFEKYKTNHVALRIAYLGEDYHGFAFQPNACTVEGEIFKAMKRLRLILDRESCDFTRCGRTDAGVSGMGQVISCRLRSNLLLDESEDRVEFNYPKMLNGKLPPDIRVTGHQFVSSSFNARFDCTFRMYKYFFVHSDLDTNAMRQAALFFIGRHSFHNFCRLDKSNPPLHFEREILLTDIEKVSSDVSAFVVKGTAFLYNQVRCMMAVLFRVGKGESPTIVKEMLTETQLPGYEIASEKNLLFFDCGFDGLEFIDSDFDSFEEIYREQTVRKSLVQQMLHK